MRGRESSLVGEGIPSRATIHWASSPPPERDASQWMISEDSDHDHSNLLICESVPFFRSAHIPSALHRETGNDSPIETYDSFRSWDKNFVHPSQQSLSHFSPIHSWQSQSIQHATSYSSSSQRSLRPCLPPSLIRSKWRRVRSYRYRNVRSLIARGYWELERSEGDSRVLGLNAFEKRRNRGWELYLFESGLEWMRSSLVKGMH